MSRNRRESLIGAFLPGADLIDEQRMLVGLALFSQDLKSWSWLSKAPDGVVTTTRSICRHEFPTSGASGVCFVVDVVDIGILKTEVGPPLFHHVGGLGLGHDPS